MSRCFGFPPPGYVRNGLSGEALIESIKREIEKAITEKNREKKERKSKERKEKTLEEDDETDQLQKSCVTEEHEQPLVSQKTCYLSDSSSNKRKRFTSLYDDEMRKEKALYKALIGDWVPIPIPIQSRQEDLDNQDWLFGTTQGKTLKPGYDDDVQCCCGSPSLTPRAHYLPEADIYALPYIIPF